MQPGNGRIIVASHSEQSVFTELSSTYPLKLLSPSHDSIAVVYMLTYGGGLVGGDAVNLVVEIGPLSRLILSSQGSTKVFKTRAGTSNSPGTATKQTVNATLSPKSALFLMPEPVTCFRSASYNQIQTFRLLGDATIVVLDWITSGRKSIGEDWVFSRYFSVNEIWVDGQRLARDALLLQDDTDETAPLPHRCLRDRLAPYSCYATMILYGPLALTAIASLDAEYQKILVFKARTPSNLIWSFSPLTCSGAIVRVAGHETEDVKRFFRNSLKSLEVIVGVDVYRRAFDSTG